MKRILCLFLVFSVFFAVSCSSKKKSHDENGYIEKVSKEISAEEGGTVESEDKSISIDIPAGALDSDTTITMTVFDAEGYAGTQGMTVLTRVVEFEPSGMVFKKPVTISMTALEDVDGNITRAAVKKVVTAAVYREEKGAWSYSKTGAAVKISGKDSSGDPIMTTAAGDPIMLSAAGDPIMMTSGGEQKMLSAAGDPIMVTAAGDPIMNSAAGDPIMMTTGHFSSYTFFVIDLVEESGGSDDEPAEADDDEPSETDDDEPAETDDDEPAEPDDDEPAETDEDVIPEPEPQYSNVLCTNMTICTNDEGEQIICPAEDAEFYGQDAQYAARKSCVPHHSFAKIPKNEFIENDFVEVKDDFTGLTWLFTGVSGAYEDLKTGCDISYGGSEEWRLPTPKELLTLAHNDMLFRSIPALDPFYFDESGENSYFGSYAWSSVEGYLYSLEYGDFLPLEYYAERSSYLTDGLLLCVSGKEYGKVKAASYVPLAESGGKVIFDAGTNLYWQKDSAQADTWKEALSYCENLEYAGYDDWRLPNKNELLSLVDYSKAGTEAEVLSSFPGMTPDIFWSSTGADYGAWLVYMKDGTLGVTGGENLNGGPGDDIVVNAYFMRSIKRDEIEEEEDLHPVVRCVRSLLDEKNDIPACGETGIAPCRDANGTVWSSVIYPEFFAGFDKELIYGEGDPGVYRRGSEKSVSTVDFYSVVNLCHDLYESGSHKWRLPTIDEIRSLVTTDKLKTGGSCGVTDEHFESSYFTEDTCTGDDPSETILFDYGFMLSGTLNLEYYNPEEEVYPELWGVSVYNGALAAVPEEIPLSVLTQRCVLDETLNYEETPYLDPETGLLWSDISSGYLDFEEAETYCFDLTMADTEHYWRLPTIDELKTLVVNCSEDEAPCPIDMNGKYSVLGDNKDLWSSEQVGDDESYHYILYFDDVSVYEGHYSSYTRCVSDGPNPCKNDPCSGFEHATGCVPESAEEYFCACESGYVRTEDGCVPGDY